MQNGWMCGTQSLLQLLQLLWLRLTSAEKTSTEQRGTCTHLLSGFLRSPAEAAIGTGLLRKENECVSNKCISPNV